MRPLFDTDRVAGFFFLAACLGWFVFEAIVALRDHRRGNTPTRDRHSGVVVFAGILIAISMGFGFAFAAPQLTMTRARTFIFYGGIFLILAGVVFRWYAIRILGKYFTRQVLIQPGQGVVKTGPYRFIRHPSYAGTLITFLGLGMVLTNWLSLIFVPVLVGLGHGYRVRVEERVLVDELGEPYREYMKNTKRFIPFVY